MSTQASADLFSSIDDNPRMVTIQTASRVGEHWEQTAHQHRKAQLLYSVRGILKVEVHAGVWIVPPQSAIWVPGGAVHSARGSGATECHCLFIEPDASPLLPASCCTLSVSALLREMILRTASFGESYPAHGVEERLVAALLDELAVAPVQDLHLPLPNEPRLRRLAEMLMADPGTKTSIGDWAIRIGMSERSMSRLLLREIGMSFGRWRRQLHIILALQRMTKGENVQTVALELGYENASSFVTMFRKSVGKPPAQYLSSRVSSNGATDGSVSLLGIVMPDSL